LPVTNPRPGQPSEIVGSQIWLLAATGSSIPVTDGEPGIYDLDPCITRDRKTVYYSSDRGGQRGIWKKGVSVQGRSPVDPGRGVDVEPAVFATSEGVTRVTFTRYSPRAAVGTPPVIVVQEEDRLSFAETTSKSFMPPPPARKKPGMARATSTCGGWISTATPSNSSRTRPMTGCPR
jgi:hypothetical protein